MNKNEIPLPRNLFETPSKENLLNRKTKIIIDASVRISQEIYCLPYAGFLIRGLTRHNFA